MSDARQFTDSGGDTWDIKWTKSPFPGRVASRLTRRASGCWPSFCLWNDNRVTTAGEVPVDVARWALAYWASEDSADGKTTKPPKAVAPAKLRIV